MNSEEARGGRAAGDPALMLIAIVIRAVIEEICREEARHEQGEQGRASGVPRRR